MTATAVEAKTYKTFTWQAISKIADEIGVRFYSASTYSVDKGIGLRAYRYDKSLIVIDGYERVYTTNEWTQRRFHTLVEENFKLKLELWALKNDVKIEFLPDSEWKFRIVDTTK